MVGPCIVGGWENFSGEALGDLLYEQLVSEGLAYKVKKVLLLRYPSSKWKAILEHEIRQNDIVLFIEDIFERTAADFDLTDSYNNYTGENWLYADIPGHTTRTGNAMIANELVQNIIMPVSGEMDEALDQTVVQKGEPQLTQEEEMAIYHYLDGIKAGSGHFHGVIGACMMTCNPFTKGHYHLIEYASRQVDFLYVFVVEEDAFYFSFEDRLEMVKRGVAGLSNAAVFPTGRIIGSKETASGYFMKTINPDLILDASKDTFNFREYVAPYLNISKRFVGEEPYDKVTKQYNEALKRDLSGAVEVVEIPRYEEDGEVISGNAVRRYLRKRNWKEIEKHVPPSTLEYLKSHIDIWEERDKERDREEIPAGLERLIRFIQCHQKVVFCGMGADAGRLMWQIDWLLSAEEAERLEFYDKRAAKMHKSYRGKRILSFSELIDKHKDDYMVITTSKYRKDLFCRLIENGVKPDHILVSCEQI